MNDCISRAALKKRYMELILARKDGKLRGSTIVNELELAPTIDPVHAAGVCYCRECKHYHAGTGWCEELSFFHRGGEPCSPAESMDWKMFGEDDFCSLGEPKEEP